MLVKLIEWIGTILMNIGSFAVTQSCVGFLHEVEIPEELREIE